MKAHLILAKHGSTEATPDGGDDSTGLKPGEVKPAVVAALKSKQFFWLDLESLDAEGEALLRDAFRFHQLAVDDAKSFGQRPKLDEYDDFVYLVVYGVEPKTHKPFEVHCFYAKRALVTVHRGSHDVFAELRMRIGVRHQLELKPAMLVHQIVDVLVDGFFPALSTFDDRIDKFEADLIEKPTDQQLADIFTMKRSLVNLRKIVTPQRDLFASLVSDVSRLPGADMEAERYFRDIYDHLIRISDLIDSYRDLLSGAMDAYLSTVSNRLNAVMKQLTIIATIFLPLSFITGFFGQNFGWMIGHIDGMPAFLLFGIGGQLLTAGGLLFLFKRRGWF